MQRCTSLQHISLRRSAVGDEGCQLICHATKLLGNIQSLDLSSCGITAGGVLAVVEMLKVSFCMRSVQSCFLHKYSVTNGGGCTSVSSLFSWLCITTHQHQRDSLLFSWLCITAHQHQRDALLFSWLCITTHQHQRDALLFSWLCITTQQHQRDALFVVSYYN
jgi:hypothetical protein